LPDTPDFLRTEMLDDKSYIINPISNPTGFVSFRLFDKFGNKYTRY